MSLCIFILGKFKLQNKAQRRYFVTADGNNNRNAVYQRIFIRINRVRKEEDHRLGDIQHPVYVSGIGNIAAVLSEKSLRLNHIMINPFTWR